MDEGTVMSGLDGHDQVAVRGITARGFPGVFDVERREGQTFVVDVVLGVDTRQAAATDDLADTTDYSAVAVAVVALVEGEPVDLIETLAEQIADACLAFDGVRAVEVTVHKPEAPVGVTFADVTVTIVRPR